MRAWLGFLVFLSLSSYSLPTLVSPISVPSTALRLWHQPNWGFKNQERIQKCIFCPSLKHSWLEESQLLATWVSFKTGISHFYFATWNFTSSSSQTEATTGTFKLAPNLLYYCFHNFSSELFTSHVTIYEMGMSVTITGILAVCLICNVWCVIQLMDLRFLWNMVFGVGIRVASALKGIKWKSVL